MLVYQGLYIYIIVHIFHSMFIFWGSVPTTPNTRVFHKLRCRVTRPWWKCRPPSWSNEWPAYIPTRICRLRSMGPTRETDDGHIDYRYITYKHHDINIYKQKQETREIMLFTDPTSCTDSLPSELKDRKLKKKTPVVKHGNVKSKKPHHLYIYTHYIQYRFTHDFPIWPIHMGKHSINFKNSLKPCTWMRGRDPIPMSASSILNVVD